MSWPREPRAAEVAHARSRHLPSRPPSYTTRKLPVRGAFLHVAAVVVGPSSASLGFYGAILGT